MESLLEKTDAARHDQLDMTLDGEAAKSTPII
jgi:hypothetical protein